MRRLGRLVLVSVIAGSLIVPTATPSAAATRRGKVVAVNDGDTFDIDFSGDGAADARVRMIGVQAMELTDYVRKTGQCHGREAWRRLNRLIGGKTVRVSAENPNSVGLKGRIQRFVSVRRNGKWRDVGRILLRQGHALWFPHHDEHAKNVAYQRAARKARARGVGVWNPTHCRKGPNQAMKLKMWVQWDADGVDGQNVNGEWVKIRNVGTSDAKIGRWVLRESALRESHSPTSPLRQYRFPRGVTIPAGKAIYVHAGKGTNRGNRYYWGQSKPIFENWEPNGRNVGDGAYLFDRHGDLRFDFMYPCLKKRCRDKLMGDVEVSRVVYDPDGTDVPRTELIRLRIPPSSSRSRINLEGYLLESWPYSYPFDAGDFLNKGETLTVVVGGKPSASTRLLKFWGLDKIILDNPGDRVRIRTFDNIIIDCHAWGNARC